MNIYIAFLNLAIFLAIIIILNSLRGTFLHYRSDLEPKLGTCPDSGRYIFYLDINLPPTEKQKRFIDTNYGRNSLVLDKNKNIYKILDVRRRSKVETEHSCIGTVVFEVEQYPNNTIYKIPMHAYGRSIYIIENDQFFIDLSGYEYDMFSILDLLNEEESFISIKMKNLLYGFPILVEEALDIGTVVASHSSNYNSHQASLFIFWKDICTELIKLNTTDSTKNNYRTKQIYEITNNVIKIMLSVLAEMSERCVQLQKRDEVELTYDFQASISHVLCSDYCIQISREYPLGRSIKKLGETDLFFYRFQDGYKRQLYILENKEIEKFTSQYQQLMGYLNPCFLAGFTLSINRGKRWEEAYDYIIKKLMELRDTEDIFAPISIEKITGDNGTIFIKTMHTVPETGFLMPVYHLVLQLYDDDRHKIAIIARQHNSKKVSYT